MLEPGVGEFSPAPACHGLLRGEKVLTLKQLEAFYWSAILGSFSLAAQHLQMTQSSVSKRIEELEASLENLLFDRSGKRALLTRRGEQLLPLITDMLTMRDRVSTLPRHDAPLTGGMRIGVSEMMSITWLPGFVARVGAEHPGLKFSPHVAEMHELQRLVAKGELDFALTPGPISDPDLHANVAVQLDFIWVGSPTLLNGTRYITRDELARYIVIVKAENSRISGLMANVAGEVGHPSQRTLIGGSLTAMVGLMLAGVGLACMSKAYVKVWCDQGLLTPVECELPAPRLAYYFIRHKDDRRHSLRRLWSYIEQGKDLD